MTTRLYCDGCGAELRLRGEDPRENMKDLVLEGCNVSGLTGVSSFVPRGEFHLCGGCATIAFRALQGPGTL